jgi:hypothetical protein
MKQVQFKTIRPGQRFWTTVDDSKLVEHIRLYEPIMGEKETDTGIGPIIQREVEWNAVELNNGRCAEITDQTTVFVIDGNEHNAIVTDSSYGDGTKPTHGKCVQVLEVVDHYLVETRSLSGLGFNDFYDQITKRFKVNQMVHLTRKTIVG